MMKKSLKNEILGIWKLVSWKYLNSNKESVDFFGKNPQGFLVYDASGYMCTQLMRGSRSNFISESMTAGTSEEVGNAYFEYLAYWGKYYEKTPGELIHEVEGSLFPNWMGANQIRYGKIDGTYLTLSTPPLPALGKKIEFDLIWKRG